MDTLGSSDMETTKAAEFVRSPGAAHHSGSFHGSQATAFMLLLSVRSTVL
jgi:hypothetical protein